MSASDDDLAQRYFPASGVGDSVRSLRNASIGELTSWPRIGINIVGFLTTLIAAIILGVAEAAVQLIQLPFQFVIGLFDAISSFMSQLIQTVFGASGVIQVAFVSAQADVIGAGIGAFAVGTLVVASTSLIINYGVSFLVGE